MRVHFFLFTLKCGIRDAIFKLKECKFERQTNNNFFLSIQRDKNVENKIIFVGILIGNKLFCYNQT